jgi:hypothetical protein
MRWTRLRSLPRLIACWLCVQAASLHVAEASQGRAVSLSAQDGCPSSLVAEMTTVLRVELLARLLEGQPQRGEDAYRATMACSDDVVTLSVSADGRVRSSTPNLAPVPASVRPRVAALALAELVRDLDRDVPAQTVAAHPPPAKILPPRAQPPSATPAIHTIELSGFAVANDFVQHGVALQGGGLRFGYSRGPLCVGLEVAILSDTERFAPGTVRAILTYGSPYVGWQQAWHVWATRLGAGYALGAARLSGSATTPLAYARTITDLWASPYLFGEVQLRVTAGLGVLARGQLGWSTSTVTGQVAGGSDVSLGGLWAGGQLGLASAFN